MGDSKQMTMWARFRSFFSPGQPANAFDIDDPWFEVVEANKNPEDTDLLAEAADWRAQENEQTGNLLRMLLKTRNFHDSSVLDGINQEMAERGVMLGSVQVGAIDNIEIPAINRNIPARVYSPKKGFKSGPLVVYYHGGGWVTGSIDSVDNICRELCEEVPCKIIAVEYRKAPDHVFPAAYLDSLTAFKWVCDQAESLGGRRDMVFVGGDDAGGNLAAAVAYQCDSDNDYLPRGMFLYYPVLDVTESGRFSFHRFASGYGYDARIFQEYVSCYVPALKERPISAVSPLLAVSLKGMPPSLIISAQFDILRDQACEMALRLQQEQVPVRYRCIPGTLHGFMSLPGMKSLSATVIGETGFFIRKICGVK